MLQLPAISCACWRMLLLPAIKHSCVLLRHIVVNYMPPKRPFSATEDAPAAAVSATAATTAPSGAPASEIAAPLIVAATPPVAGAVAAAPAAAVSPVPAPAPLAPMPPSPGRNRQLFLATVTPQHMTCDLSSAVVGMGCKHNLVAVVIASYPVQNGPPARRHLTVCDAHGCTGVTVWNTDVHKFPKAVLGGVVTITRASVSLYQGKKSLVLNKDSAVVVSTTTRSPLADWWADLACQSPLPLPAALIAADNTVISVFGVLAFTSRDEKEVNGVVRTLTSVHLASQTVKLQLRGWDLEPATMELIESLKDCVVQVHRVRVTCFAELKIGEIMESPLGTIFAKFNDPELTRFWNE